MARPAEAAVSSPCAVAPTVGSAPRDIATPGRGARLLQEAAAAWKVELRWIDGAGHFPFAARPELFADIVARFVTGDGSSPRRP
jgi:pimeloyl-ACP methyl ester carboxylesterase